MIKSDMRAAGVRVVDAEDRDKMRFKTRVVSTPYSLGRWWSPRIRRRKRSIGAPEGPHE